MAWTAPITTYVSNDGWGFADANKINANLTYLREETATFNGRKTFTDSIEFGLDSFVSGKSRAYLNASSGLVLTGGGGSGSEIALASSLGTFMANFSPTIINFLTTTTVNGGDFGINTTNPLYLFDELFSAGAGNMFRVGQSGVTNGFTITTDGARLTYDFATGDLLIPAIATFTSTAISLLKPTTITGALTTDSVKTDNVFEKTKLLTGNLPVSASVNIAHGLTDAEVLKVMSISLIYNSGSGIMRSIRDSNSRATDYSVQPVGGGSTVTFLQSTASYGDPYRIEIKYEA